MTIDSASRVPPYCAGEPIADSLSDWDGWLKAHESLLTASDAPKAMHIPWTTGKYQHTGQERYQELFDRKVSGEPLEQNEKMFWGHELEATILAALLRAPSARIRELGITDLVPCGWLIRDPECRFLGATPDFFCLLDGVPTVGDLKVSGFAWKPTKAKPSPALYVPTDYQIQIQVQMACTGARQGLLVQHAEGVIANAIPYERDEQIVQEAREAAEIFMGEVEEARAQ